MPAEPLVSCLMVTLSTPGRLEFQRRAISAYCAQTYARRELLIVMDPGPSDANKAIVSYVAGLDRDDIRIIETDRVLTVGALRNLSRAGSYGEVHCQWDDDDFHHPERVERQMAALAETGALAVCLQEVMQYFPAVRTLYCTNWRATMDTVHSGTLMCRATAPVCYAESGPNAQLGEDSYLTAQLQRLGGLHALADAPHLFVYVSHGANSWDD